MFWEFYRGFVSCAPCFWSLFLETSYIVLLLVSFWLNNYESLVDIADTTRKGYPFARNEIAINFLIEMKVIYKLHLENVICNAKGLKVYKKKRNAKKERMQ